MLQHLGACSTGMHAGGANLSDEAAFADILAEHMQGRISAADAVASFAEACEHSAAQMRCAPDS